MPRIVTLVLSTLVLGGCAAAAPGSSAPSSRPMPSVAPTTHPTESPSTTPSTLPSASAGPPAFGPEEPLVLTGLVASGGGGIFVIRPDGTDRTQLATDVLPGVHKRGDWSPDGQHVVFADETTGWLYVAHLDGSPTTRLPVCEMECDHPRWSPDGKRIAYSAAADPAPGMEGPASVGIDVLDLATGEVTHVIRLERPILADIPTWSPDGKRIAFQVDRMDDEAYETGAAIAVVPVQGGESTYLTPFEAFGSSPDWSWTTDEIAFSTELVGLQRVRTPGDETWDLWAVRPDGTTEPRALTHLAAGRQLVNARWTADGSQLTAKEPGERGVIVDASTGEVTTFLTGGFDLRPAIRPLPSS